MYRLTHLLLSAAVLSASLSVPLYAAKKGTSAAMTAEIQLKKEIDDWKARADRAMKMPYGTEDEKRAARAEVNRCIRKADDLIARSRQLLRTEWETSVRNKANELRQHRQNFN